VRLASGISLALLLAARGSAAERSPASPTAASTVANTAASASAATTPAQCAATVASALGQVGARVYHEAATGGNVSQAIHRVQSSTALRSAVGSGNISLLFAS
jgi:hypothetical protein